MVSKKDHTAVHAGNVLLSCRTLHVQTVSVVMGSMPLQPLHSPVEVRHYCKGGTALCKQTGIMLMHGDALTGDSADQER